jgi:hypothetical protein
MLKDVEGADRMLLQLSHLLRTTLARNAAHEIKLEQMQLHPRCAC